MKNKIKPNKKELEKAEGIKYLVCAQTGINVRYLATATRKKEVMKARKYYCYLADRYTNLSTDDIAFSVYPEYDRTSVIHHIKDTINLMEVDKSVKGNISLIVSILEQEGHIVKIDYTLSKIGAAKKKLEWMIDDLNSLTETLKDLKMCNETS